MRRRFGFALVGLSVLLAVVGLYGCKTSGLVSESQEVEVGQQASQQIESQYPVSRDAQLNALVDDIGQYIAKRSDRPNLQYTFKVLDIKDVNAVSLPGGWVYVYRGLIDLVGGSGSPDKDMLAGVIAHEVGHIAARHAAQQMGRETIYGTAIGALTKGNARQYASIFANLNLLHFSREDEYEADHLSIKYLYGSRYNPEGIIRFLTLLQSKSSDPATLPFLRTHPVTNERIKRATDYLNQLKSGAAH